MKCYLQYTYDHRNRLTLLQWRTSAHALTRQVRYTYDAMDRRIGKEIDATGNGSFETAERFAYDGDDLVVAFNGAGSVLSRYWYALGQEAPLVEVAGEEQFWTLTDHQGSVEAVVYWSLALGGGSMQMEMGAESLTLTGDGIYHGDYSAFGVPMGFTDVPSLNLGTSNGFRFGYTGQEFEAESGLWFYDARYFDPNAGGFINQDPAGFGAGDGNLYRYVFNSPPNYTDPSGTNAAPPSSGSVSWSQIGGAIGTGLSNVAGRIGSAYADMANRLVITGLPSNDLSISQMGFYATRTGDQADWGVDLIGLKNNYDNLTISQQRFLANEARFRANFHYNSANGLFGRNSTDVRADLKHFRNNAELYENVSRDLRDSNYGYAYDAGISGWTGAVGGLAIAADTFTFGLIDSLHQKVLTDYSGSMYAGSRAFATIARESFIAAGTAGLGSYLSGTRAGTSAVSVLSKAHYGEYGRTVMATTRLTEGAVAARGVIGGAQRIEAGYEKWQAGDEMGLADMFSGGLQVYGGVQSGRSAVEGFRVSVDNATLGSLGGNIRINYVAPGSRTATGPVSLPLAPESQGAHNLMAQFENVPSRMWARYPQGLPRPTGPINMRNGTAYGAARELANRVNNAKPHPGWNIHEINSVKFGGSPVAATNKLGVRPTLHYQLNTWFRRLQRIIEG